MLNWLKRCLQRYRGEAREEAWPLEVEIPGQGSFERSLVVGIHPARAERIVVMIPGCNGSLEGYERKYAKLAEHLVEARRKELLSVPDCDHQFRGARNGRIMSQAPLWAFHGQELPDPEGGIHLYD